LADEQVPDPKGPGVLSHHDTGKYLEAFRQAWNDLKPYGPSPLLTFTALVVLAICSFVVFRGEPWAVGIGGCAVILMLLWHLRMSSVERHREHMRELDVEEQKNENRRFKSKRRAALPLQGVLNLPEPSYKSKDSSGAKDQ
jgi:hypothetical protein